MDETLPIKERHTIPGTITKAVALLTALAGLLTALQQMGLFTSPSATTTSSSVQDQHSSASLAPLQPTATTEIVTPDRPPQPSKRLGLFVDAMLGAWTWGDQPCREGPHVTSRGAQLVFTTPSSRFVHEISSDDGTRARTVVIAPEEHRGEIYTFELRSGTLAVIEGQQTNVWTRCKD